MPFLLGSETVLRAVAAYVIGGDFDRDGLIGGVVEYERLRKKLPVGNDFQALVIGVFPQERGLDENTLVAEALVEKKTQADTLRGLFLMGGIREDEGISGNDVCGRSHLLQGGQDLVGSEAVAGIHEEAPVASGVGNALVHGIVDALVRFADGPGDDPGESREQFRSSVRRGTVDDNAFEGTDGLGGDALQRLSEALPIIPVDGYDGYLHRDISLGLPYRKWSRRAP